MRIDFRIQDSEPAADALRALPPRERANALRLMLRRHFGDLPGLIDFRPTPSTAATASSAEPAAPATSATEPDRAKDRLRVALDAIRARCAMVSAAALATAALLAFAPMHVAQAATWRVDANLASIHTERWARDSLNQRNPGLGVTWQASRTWALAGGTYSNSYRRPTIYALAEFTPLHIGQVNHWHVDAGVAAGLASGYTRAEIPCAPLVGAALIRVTAPEGIAVGIMGVPNMGPRNSGFIGFQLSFPLH